MSKNYRRESYSRNIKSDEKIERVGVNITVDGKVELRINNKVVQRLDIAPQPPVMLGALPTKKEVILNQFAG